MKVAGPAGIGPVLVLRIGHSAAAAVSRRGHADQVGMQVRETSQERFSGQRGLRELGRSDVVAALSIVHLSVLGTLSRAPRELDQRVRRRPASARWSSGQRRPEPHAGAERRFARFRQAASWKLRLALDHPVLRVFGTGDLTRSRASFRADSWRGLGVC